MHGLCRAALQDLWDTLRSQKGRIGLTFMAVAVGVASLAVLMALLGGLEDKSRRMVKGLGVNVVGILQQGGGETPHGTRLGPKHRSYLRSNFPDVSIAAVRRWAVPIPDTNQVLTMLATDSTLRHVRQWPLFDGRFLDAQDIHGGERHAVISRTLSDSRSWKVGDVILLGRIPFQIVGIVDSGGGDLEAELNDAGLMLGEHLVFVPETVAANWVDERTEPELLYDSIFIRVLDSDTIEHVVATAQRLLLHPDYRVDQQLSWITPESLLRNIRRLQKAITLTVGSIALLCLLLGGTTMMSLMIADIRRRVPEIGLRMAMGATRRDIAMMFVAEGCTVTCLAGIAGSAAAYAVLAIGRGSISITIRYDYIGMAIPVLVAVFLGAVFSYWPARMAARIAPAEALRNE